MRSGSHSLGGIVTGAEERKVVSVLFCDLVGFTAASEDADPEDVRGWLAPYHETLRSTVERFGGTVEKFAGDAILAVFGAPRSHEDDAERAVRAGLAILDALAPGALQVRVGINTGEVLVDLGARPELGEPFVTGTVVNSAARLQASAPVGAVVVGEPTYRATSRVFAYEALEPVAAKGLSTPLARWQAGEPLAPGDDRPRTPFVGRTRDMLLLRTAYEKAVEERAPQFVFLVGEPGIGKSRLVDELGAQLADSGVTWRDSRCLPYGERSFRQLAEIVKQHAGILDTDDAEVAASKLDAVLPDGVDAAWMRHRLQPLLGVGSPRESGPAQPDASESFEAWRRLIESFAETGPAVVVIEDLHWADDALLAFLDHLAEWTAGLPLVVIGTSRPEFLERHPPTAPGLTLSLSRLSDAETGELLGRLLPGREVPEDMLERSGGNPLYAEELARMLTEAGLHAGDLPGGVAAIIAARLDTLDPVRKSLIADAAVVGGIFWAEAVAAVGGRDTDEVVQLLHELSRKELVRPLRRSSMAGRHEYAFWHVLVRDVAYGQLPRAARISRHVAAADWLEEQYAHRPAEAADELAYHLGTALDLAIATGDTATVATTGPRLRRYAWLAGERAMHLDAHRATALLDRALELTAPDDPERPGLLTDWGWAAFLAGRVDEALAAFTEAIGGFEAVGDTRGVALALRFSTYATTAGMQESLATIERAVALLEPLGPSQDLVDALASLASFLLAAGRRGEAIEVADRSLRIAAEHDLRRPLRSLEVRGLSRIGAGDAAGLADLKESLAGLLEAGQGRGAGVSWLNYAFVLWQLEGPAAGLAELAEAQEFARRRRLAELLQAMACTVLQPTLEIGGLTDVVTLCREQLDAAGPAFTVLRRIEVLAALARAEYELGRPEAAGHAEEAYSLAVPEGWPDLIVVAAAPVALTRAAAGDRDGVREVLERIAGLSEVASSHEFASRAPALVRAGLAVGEADLAARVAAHLSPLLPTREYAAASAQALLAEHNGERQTAAAGFAAAAAGWGAFGNKLEQAYALLGQGRCGSDAAATEAGELLSAMDTLRRT